MMTIPLIEAKHQFLKIYESLCPEDVDQFAGYVFNEVASRGDCSYLSYNEELNETEDVDLSILEDPVRNMTLIANYIKKKVPISAILSSENINSPVSGENADCLSDLTAHVDEFLYNEDDVDELVENGQLMRYYCKDCKSKNIESLIFISHSMPRTALYYIFNNVLPTLEGKTVLDVGSRLGAILYGAYLYTDAAHIIGVEMNEDLCKLQSDVIRKYKMKDRVEVLHNRIEAVPETVESADVIVLNNVFEFYMPEEDQIQIWQFLRSHIKSKAILVTQPHLETTFKNLNTGIKLSEWVKHFKPKVEANGHFRETIPGETEYCNIAFYEVL